MMARMKRFLGDPDGSAAVQFALILPLLLLLIFGSFEYAVVMFVSGMLESAVLAGSRYGATGFEDGGGSRIDRIRAMITDKTLGFVDGDNARIDTYVFPNFGSIVAPEPFTDTNNNGAWNPGEPFVDLNGNGTRDAGSGTPGPGAACEIVLYVVTYQTRSITGLLRPIMGTITHHASVAVRNEPFSSTPCSA
jgi:Flp pilus assembly protein TadG